MFGCKLRLVVMDTLERIEVAFRAVWYMDAAQFVPKYRHDKFCNQRKQFFFHLLRLSLVVGKCGSAVTKQARVSLLG